MPGAGEGAEKDKQEILSLFVGSSCAESRSESRVGSSCAASRSESRVGSSCAESRVRARSRGSSKLFASAESSRSAGRRVLLSLRSG